MLWSETASAAVFKSRPEGPEHAIQIAAALAEVIGELVAPAPEALRDNLLAKMDQLIRAKCAQDVARAAERPAGPAHLH